MLTEPSTAAPAPADGAQPSLSEPGAAQPDTGPPDPVSWASGPATPVAGPRDTGTAQPGDSQPASDWPATTGSGTAQVSDAQAGADTAGQRGGRRRVTRHASVARPGYPPGLARVMPVRRQAASGTRLVTSR
jgi:hypothetical protein